MAQTHHYLFDTSGTYNDATGTTHFTNTTGSIDASGLINQCYKSTYDMMGGYNAYTSANPLPTSGAFSISFWLKAWGSASGGGTVFQWYNPSTLMTALTVVCNSSNSEVAVTQGASSRSVYSAFSTSVWHHLVFTCTGTAWTIYLDGTAVTMYGSNFTPSSDTYASNSNLRIIGGVFSGGFYIDDLRFHDAVVDSAEVTFLYNSGTGTQSDYSGGGGSPSPVTSAFYKFQPFVEAAMEGIHNFGSHQLKVALTNTAPSAANAVLADISEIASYAGCSTRNVVTSTSGQISGTYKLVCAPLVLTASGAVGPFRYVVLYNDTAASDNLIAYYDYASSVTLASGDTFTIGFNGTTGVLTVT
jgi:hypothetical protein